MSGWPVDTVWNLQQRGILHVEDGNHGENRPLQDEFGQVGTPFIRPPDLIGGRVDFSSAEKINEKAMARIRKGKGRPGDVLFSHRATVGRMAIIPEDAPVFVTNPGVTIYRCLDASVLDRRFLYFWMQSSTFMDQVWAVAGGGDTFPYASLTEQRKLSICIPTINEQREIAAILGALDDKIGLNRKTAATLEAMARALYRSWFVDFDPVQAKSEGHPPAHMDPATAALFPDSFAENGLPMGWASKGLDEIADFLNGAALQKFPAEEGEDWRPVIKISERRNGVTASCGRASVNIRSKYRVMDGDVLFSWSGSLLQRVWTGGPGALNQHLFKVTSSVVPKWFHFFAVDQHMEEFQAIAASKATTMGHIQRHHLTQATVTVPPSDILQAADGLIAPLFQAGLARTLENQTLATLRDTLLPRLMSGDLRVGEAREHLEAVS